MALRKNSGVADCGTQSCRSDSGYRRPWSWRGDRFHCIALDAWFDEVRKANWTSTADVKRFYASASIVTADRIVFNVKGNDYRLLVSVDFEKCIVWIKWIGTHKDYDRINVKEVEHEKA